MFFFFISMYKAKFFLLEQMTWSRIESYLGSLLLRDHLHIYKVLLGPCLARRSAITMQTTFKIKGGGHVFHKFKDFLKGSKLNKLVYNNLKKII